MRFPINNSYEKALLLLQPLLSSFKWYRKKKGGIWYKMYDFQAGGGFEGSPCFWTQKPPGEEAVIMKTENYGT